MRIEPEREYPTEVRKLDDGDWEVKVPELGLVFLVRSRGMEPIGAVGSGGVVRLMFRPTHSAFTSDFACVDNKWLGDPESGVVAGPRTLLVLTAGVAASLVAQPKAGRVYPPPGVPVLACVDNKEYDTFTDTAGTALPSHTGEVGATWGPNDDD